MCENRSRPLSEKVISIVFNSDLGLCVELGDREVDGEVYGYGPTQNFILAVIKEIWLHTRNTIGNLDTHPTLKRVHERLQKGVKKSVCE